MLRQLYKCKILLNCLLIGRLGFGILFCFVLKAESQLRGPPFLSSGSGSSTQSGSSLKQTKFSTSKTSLEDNYCTTTTASINSPLSFYTNHDKEKENECLAASTAAAAVAAASSSGKQALELSAAAAAAGTATVQLPLTIISTAPRSGQAGNNAETLLNAHQPLTVAATAAGTASPAARCCALLSGSNNVEALGAGNALGYAYDAYTLAGGLTGSLGRRLLHQQHQQHLHQQQQQQQQHFATATCDEYVGVETLDILQGVAADSIIGILPAGAPHYVPLQHNPYVDFLPSTLMLSMPTATPAAMPPPPTISGNLSGNISSATLPTPKTQKRVTILEPTSRTTFDPLLPTMVAAVVSTTTTTSTASTTAASTPTTQSAQLDSSHATLDRITHDLDYLLNRGALDVDAAAAAAATAEAQQQSQLSSKL
ncbi:CG31714 [Drosophila busckii]|uniref:CG31714 n=1 Tax=Drosophila busckii TaxID=30019 RepID=A0A0M3QTL9_DROBS|nr:CG31714 [Drosophila busckii]